MCCSPAGNVKLPLISVGSTVNAGSWDITIEWLLIVPFTITILQIVLYNIF